MDISPILSRTLSRTPPVLVTRRKRLAIAPSNASKYPDRTSERTAAIHETGGDNLAAYRIDATIARRKLITVIQLGESPALLKNPADHSKKPSTSNWSLDSMTRMESALAFRQLS